MADNYISPTGNNDVSSVWSNEANAYDGDTGTYANTTITAQQWSGYIEFTFSEIVCDKIKVWVARQFSAVNDMEIDYYNGSWVSLRSGDFTTGSYQEYAIGSRVSITKIRIRFFNNASSYDNYARIHEVLVNDWEPDYSQSVGGSFSSTGSISKATTKTFSGAFGFAGSISKAISKTLSGTLDFSGTLTRLRIYFKTLSGEFSFSGGITQKAIGKVLTGTVGFTGIIQRAITKTLTGTLNFTGIVSKGIYKTISGVLSFTGGITNKAISKVLRGSLSMTAKVLYWFEKIFGSVSWTEETKSDESWTEVSKSDEDWDETTH